MTPACVNCARAHTHAYSMRNQENEQQKWVEGGETYLVGVAVRVEKLGVQGVARRVEVAVEVVQALRVDRERLLAPGRSALHEGLAAIMRKRHITGAATCVTADRSKVRQCMQHVTQNKLDFLFPPTCKRSSDGKTATDLR
eukprot:6213895-Pleurochrysis_carterae.AAC.2